jgi:hypothetical protein
MTAKTLHIKCNHWDNGPTPMYLKVFREQLEWDGYITMGVKVPLA